MLASVQSFTQCNLLYSARAHHACRQGCTGRRSGSGTSTDSAGMLPLQARDTQRRCLAFDAAHLLSCRAFWGNWYVYGRRLRIGQPNLFTIFLEPTLFNIKRRSLTGTLSRCPSPTSPGNHGSNPEPLLLTIIANVVALLSCHLQPDTTILLLSWAPALRAHKIHQTNLCLPAIEKAYTASAVRCDGCWHIP